VLAWVTLSLLLFVATLALALIVWARTPAGRRTIVSRIERIAQENLNGSLSIGHLEGDLTRRIVVRDVRLYDAEGELALRVDTVEVDYHLPALLSRRVHIDALTVQGAWVHARPLRDGRENLAALGKEKPGGEPGRSLAITVRVLHGEAELWVELGPGAPSGPWRGRLALDGKLEINGDRYDAHLGALTLATETPVRALVEAAGGVHWQPLAPALHDLRVRLRTEGRQVDRVWPSAHLQGPIDAMLRADGALGGLDAALAVKAARGEMHLDAHASLSDSVLLTWRASARIQDMDPGALRVGAPHGHIELWARGEGDQRSGRIDVETLTAQVAGTHAAAHGTIELGTGVSGDLRADVSSPDLSHLASLGLPGLQGTLDAHAHVQRTPAHLHIDATVTARHVGVAAARVASLDARIHTLDLTGDARLNARDVDLPGASKTPSPVHLHSVQLAATGDHAHVALTLDALGPRGAIAQLRAHGVPLPADGPWSVDLSLDRLILGARGQRWESTGPGRLRIDRREMKAQLSIATPPSDDQVQRLALDATLERASDRVDIALHGQGLDARQLAVWARPDADVPTTQLDVDARITGALPRPGLRAHVGGRLMSWSHYELPPITLALDLASDGQRARGKLDASAENERLHARVDAPLDPNSRKPIDADVQAVGLALVRLRPLLPPSLQALAGHADVQLLLGGTPRTPELTAHLIVPDLDFADLTNNRVELDLSYRRNQLDARLETLLWNGGHGGALVAQLKAPIDLARDRAMPSTKLWDRLEHTTPVTLSVQGRALDVARLPLARFGVRSPFETGVVDIDADVHGTLHAPQAQLRVDGRKLSAAGVDGIELTLAADYAQRRAHATLDAKLHGGALLRAHAESPLDVQRIVDGLPWHDTPVTAEAIIPAYDLSRVQKLGGTLSGRASLGGTWAHPIGDAEVHALQMRLAEVRFARFDARAGWDGQSLTARVDANEVPKGSLHLDALVPADANAPMNVTLKADALSLAVSNLGSLRKLDGTLNADLQVSGPRAHALTNGFLRIDHGTFAIASDPRLFQDLTLDIVARDGTVSLRQLSTKVAGGKLAGHGTVALEGLQPKAVDLEASADRFPFQAGNVGAWIDAHANLHGYKEDSELRGTVTLSQGTANLPRLSAGRTLQSTGPLEDVVFVDAAALRQQRARERVRQGAAPEQARVVAHIPGPFKVRSREMNADLQGEFDLLIVGGVLELYGHAETTSGTIELLNRRYQIDHARASFDGSVDPDPAIDVRLTRELADATLVIEVHGTAKKPELVLASDPPIYDSSQIIGIIVSGDPGNQKIDARSTDQQVVGAISGLLVNKIKDQVAPGLPIDVIKVDPGADILGPAGAVGTRLEVGKYITDNIYVSYVHQFGTTMSGLHRVNANEANVEYRFRGRFATNIRYGDAGVGFIDFSWTLRY
jgi:autotransporter translocation and assembly factor TamB